MFYIQSFSKKLFTKCQDPNFAKGISTLIGAGLMNFLVGAIYSLCTLSVYEISYIKGIGGSIEIEHLTFYYPIEVFFQCISAFISGLINKKIGLHRTNFIGVLILSFGYFLMYLSTNLIMDLFAMILGGIGTGIILYPSTTNSYEWFKDHNGIIVGIMETSISLVSVFLLSIILMFEKTKKNEAIDAHLDNYENKSDKSDDNENESFEKLEDKDNYIPTDNKDKIKEKEKNNNNVIINNIKNNINLNNEKMSIKSESPERLVKIVLNKNQLEQKRKNNYIKKILKIALKSNRLILFCIIVVLQAPVSNMAFTLYREIGEYEKIDTKYLQLVGSLYFIFECLSSFVFGILCDLIKLKNLLLFINGVGTFVGFTYCLTFKNSLIFFLVQNFLSFSAGGYYPVKDCFLMQVFGKDIYIELSGFVSFVVALTVNIITPITYIVLSHLANKEMDYWILFLSFGSLNLIGLGLNCFLDESPIDLEKMAKNEKKSGIKV